MQAQPTWGVSLISMLLLISIVFAILTVAGLLISGIFGSKHGQRWVGGLMILGVFGLGGMVSIMLFMFAVRSAQWVKMPPHVYEDISKPQTVPFDRPPVWSPRPSEAIPMGIPSPIQAESTVTQPGTSDPFGSLPQPAQANDSTSPVPTTALPAPAAPVAVAPDAPAAPTVPAAPTNAPADALAAVPEPVMTSLNNELASTLPTPVQKSPSGPPEAKSDEQSPADSLPAWSKRTYRLMDTHKKFALQSLLWSTREEAELQLAGQVAHVASEHLGRTVFVNSDADRSLLKAVCVKDVYVETQPRDFGGFTAPMYRVWWLVELDPSTGQNLEPVWREPVVQERVLLLAAAVTVLTLASGATYVMLRTKAPRPAKVATEMTA